MKTNQPEINRTRLNEMLMTYFVIEVAKKSESIQPEYLYVALTHCNIYRMHGLESSQDNLSWSQP